MNWRRLAILVVLATGVALFLGWQAGTTEIPRAAAPEPVHWTLPASAETDSAKDMAVLTARNPWNAAFAGGSITNKDAAARAASQWRLAGIVDRPDGKFALIAIGQPATKFEYRAPGDKLPDGNVLVELSNDSATIKADDPAAKPIVLWLFRGGLSSPPPEAQPVGPPGNRRASLPPPMITARTDPPARRADGVAGGGQLFTR
jgi:hypothetical protein